MKRITYISILLLNACFIFSSCEKDFLDRKPLDRVSESQYWKTADDARLYVNSFYSIFSGIVSGIFTTRVKDQGTDNCFMSTWGGYNARFAGERTIPASGGGWSYTNIRRINYFFEHYKDIEVNFDSYKAYVGEAYFFRAYYYFELVKSFGDVPYITKTLTMDSEELYAPRTPRQAVIDSIVADLDKAIAYMASGRNAGGTRLNREIAQLFKSRVCLFEGTWEKYHNGTVFGVSNQKTNAYLNMAADAANALMASGVYSINTSGNPKQAYFNNFNWADYTSHTEVMLWKKYDLLLQMHHRSNTTVTIQGTGGLTRNLVDDYLCSDGLPKALSPLYLGDNNIINVRTNRDPRLIQTIWGPGEAVHIQLGDTVIRWTAAPMTVSNQPNVGGYHVKKYAKTDLLNLDQEATHGYPIWRFAEALLNYAEAKAELGTITQADIDKTINKLRDRVGMPHLIMNNIATDPDWQFPALSPLINEIRRERRVELALEDFRWNDLARWRAHDLIVGKRYVGAKFEPSRYPTIKVGKDLYLDSQGYIDPTQKSLVKGTFTFNPGRDYLDPLPVDQLTLNTNLDQNPGWNP